MLTAQQRDFNDKGSSNYPRDFPRWYALDYFRRPRLLKSRRWYLTVTLAVMAALASAATIGMPRLHFTQQAAPVSTAHAGFNANCATCHDRSWQPVARLCEWSESFSVSDDTCLSCHDGAIHHRNQKTQPACASCHREHQGKPVLATQVSDRHCTNCHAALGQSLKAGATTTFFQTITGFNVDHPDFAPSAPGKKDPSKIHFAHADHLQLDLDALRKLHPRLTAKYPKKELTCTDCHQVDAQGKYMQSIKYEAHCKDCHQLTVTVFGNLVNADLKKAAAEFADTPAPHQDEEIVRGVLRDRFIEFARRHNVVPEKDAAKAQPRPLPWRPVSDEIWAWTTGQVQKNAAILFANRQVEKSKDQQLTQCGQCHIENAVGLAAPAHRARYQPTEIPSRWYQHSVFNHDSHRMMKCVECHEQALTSKKATDLLLPRIQRCQECHQPSGLGRSDCVECHQYHDHKLDRSRDGPFTIEQMLRKR